MVHELEPKLIITIMHGQQYIKRFCWEAVFTLTDVIILEALNFICLREVKFRNDVNASALLTSLFVSFPGKR